MTGRVAGIESLGQQGLAFVIVHTRLDVAPGRYGSPTISPIPR
jgi:hypothetical protein